jgi:hypothetical protein
MWALKMTRQKSSPNFAFDVERLEFAGYVFLVAVCAVIRGNVAELVATTFVALLNFFAAGSNDRVHGKTALRRLLPWSHLPGLTPWSEFEAAPTEDERVCVVRREQFREAICGSAYHNPCGGVSDISHGA